MKKNVLKCLTSLLLLSCTFTMAACNNATTSSQQSSTSETSQSSEQQSSTSQSTSQAESSTSVDDSKIKSLTAKNEVVNGKIGETLLITSFYTITGYKSLSSSEKSCTYQSSDESIVKIFSKSMKLVGVGEATITVTSKIEKEKSCTFKVVVEDIYFDRNISTVLPEDDFSKELPENGGVIESKAMSSGDYFINSVKAVTWMVTVDITIKEVKTDELFPKWGIVVDSMENSADGMNNRLYFFLNGEIGESKNYNWNKFGVCEVFNGSNWAWNPGVTNDSARHCDAFYTHPTDITLETKFTMSMARDGENFHMWVNDTYVKSTKDRYYFKDLEGNATPSTVGFFQFNSDVVFENYSASTDETAVREKIDAIGEKNFIADNEWAAD